MVCSVRILHNKSYVSQARRDRLCLYVLLPTVQHKTMPSFILRQSSDWPTADMAARFTVGLCCYWHLTSYGHHCWICDRDFPDEAICVLHMFLNCPLLGSWRWQRKFTQTSVRTHRSKLRNITEERRFQKQFVNYHFHNDTQLLPILKYNNSFYIFPSYIFKGPLKL